ncbi:MULTISPECIES: element excision factor XisH family protein [Pseudanabaena]|uniref:element excision factor XisH family protein n=1 Tax=Pseudanabaena TaxID=1152 RepID=UPI002479D8AE|nr:MULTISPECIES: element excision factor XisH family protein [Pseudanabaena]MEA5485965.1 element excision factor XisH family protein [Pseudanabaena sp. CCNP1317]WGS72968.1 element excision factor XisH family protein [Pseudanabaena galeata CCNP1313]
MSARDLFHQIVKTALQKENWQITHDPYALQADSFDLAIDLGAEKIIAAEQGETKIAIEIKSFLSPSKISEFYGALGQFITYRLALQKIEPDRILYLAVPDNLYDKFFDTTLVQELMQQNTVYLITYDIDQETIAKWIPLPNTVNTFKIY